MRFVFGVRVAAIATVLLTPAVQVHSQDRSPEVFVASTSEDAGDNTEAVMTQALLQLLEQHAVAGITRKTKAAIEAQGINAEFPPLVPSSTYTVIGGKKLAIVKLRNDYANQVVVHGIVRARRQHPADSLRWIAGVDSGA